jgi:hypothetical protein
MESVRRRGWSIPLMASRTLPDGPGWMIDLREDSEVLGREDDDGRASGGLVG